MKSSFPGHPAAPSCCFLIALSVRFRSDKEEESYELKLISRKGQPFILVILCRPINLGSRFTIPMNPHSFNGRGELFSLFDSSNRISDAEKKENLQLFDL